MSTPLLAAKLFAVALGLFVAVQSYRGYRRNESEPMLYLAIGFVFISLGGAADCSLYGALGVTKPLGGYLPTCLTTVGLGTVALSLYR
ncbi:DUF7521 family protein [Haloarchaeobius sp. DFWS5]|uniref:DUF7521 family protein n=1 Tax=Haloarchaeobius sp. DFWS5 TaxID=3446114 RepID=UPI003EBB654E